MSQGVLGLDNVIRSRYCFGLDRVFRLGRGAWEVYGRAVCLSVRSEGIWLFGLGGVLGLDIVFGVGRCARGRGGF